MRKIIIFYFAIYCVQVQGMMATPQATEMYHKAQVLLEAKGGDIKKKEIVELLYSASHGGSVEACLALGRRLLDRRAFDHLLNSLDMVVGFDEDMARGVLSIIFSDDKDTLDDFRSYLELQVRRGDCQAVYVLGLLRYYGCERLGIESDKEKAFSLFSTVALPAPTGPASSICAMNPKAAYMIGQMIVRHQTPDAAPANKAPMYFLIAADQGYAPAHVALKAMTQRRKSSE